MIACLSSVPGESSGAMSTWDHWDVELRVGSIRLGATALRVGANSVPNAVRPTRWLRRGGRRRRGNYGLPAADVTTSGRKNCRRDRSAFGRLLFDLRKE